MWIRKTFGKGFKHISSTRLDTRKPWRRCGDVELAHLCATCYGLSVPTKAPEIPLDRLHPAVLTLAGLANVDPRTALRWLEGGQVQAASARCLSDALPRASAALPEHASVYAARVAT
jgi:hypothetical protein